MSKNLTSLEISKSTIVWVSLVAIVFFAGLFGVLATIAYQAEETTQTCIEAGKDWVGGECRG